jgi:hypothetical protein
METNDFLFSESCENFALDLPFIFMSSYPGVIVFGKVNKVGYITDKFFKFGIFECYKLYLAIVQILSFLTDPNEKIDKGLILERNEENYFWLGTSVLANNKQYKIAKLGIEKQDNISFEIRLTIKQFQFFFHALNKVILSSLCLIDVENKLFLFLLDKPPNTYDSKENMMNSIEAFLKVNTNVKDKKYLLYNMISHYKEIVVILFKLNTIEVPNFRQAIIAKLL